MPNLLTAPSRPPGASGRGSWKGCEYRRVDQAVGRDIGATCADITNRGRVVNLG